MTTISARIDKDLKIELQKFAEEVGIPIGTLINAWARDVVRNRRIVLDLSDELREDQEMYANADELKKEWEKSFASGRSDLVFG